MTLIEAKTNESRVSFPVVLGMPPSIFMDADDLFMSQKEASEELKRRRKDKKIISSIRKLMDSGTQEIAATFDHPKALLFRQVAAPTQEFSRFLKMAQHMRLHPLVLEYYSDKFVSSGNLYKRSLGKMPIYQRTGADGRDSVQYRTVVDFNTYTGKPFSKVQCKNGKPLIEFHHELLNNVLHFDVNKPGNSIDATAWFKKYGGSANLYYESFLSLFLCDAVLFEYIGPNVEEKKFVREVLMPAFERIEAKFGLRPLIVRLVPKNKENRIFWDSYPKKVEKFLDI